MKINRTLTVTIIIFFLLITVVPSLASEEKSGIITSGKFNKGYRYNIQGWVYIHIEGEPYERGFQHGYLASKEIIDMIDRWATWGRNVKIMNLYSIKDSEKYWEKCKNKAMNEFEPYYTDEYRQEMKGIADGVNERGETIFGRKIQYEDILTLNEIVDCWFSYRYLLKKVHPVRSIFNSFKDLININIENEPNFCSAFIATGDATSEGEIVIAHTTHIPKLYLPERFNIILDITPTNGNRFIMTTQPGSIWSMEDYYQNEKGIVLCETTFIQGPWKQKATPIAVRARNAIQYSNNIDEAIQFLKKDNNGLYANEWLIGDTKTGEIATIQLALFNTPIKRTFNGYYWSCNIAHDKKVKREIYGIRSFFKEQISKSTNYRDKKFIELGEKYYGQIDTEIAKEILSTNPICSGSSDGKITDSKMVKNMGLIVFMGNPNCSVWKPSEAVKNELERVKQLPPSGWLEMYPLNYNQQKVLLKKSSQKQDSKSIVLAKYEITNNQNQKSDLYNEIKTQDIIFIPTSSGTINTINKKEQKTEIASFLEGKFIENDKKNNRLYITTDQKIKAITTEKSTTIWEKNIKNIISKPVSTKDTVIISCLNGKIHALSSDSGNIKWSYNLPYTSYVSEIYEDNVFIGSGKKCIAYDIEKEEILWEYNTNGMITKPPILDKKTVYFGSWDGNLYSLNSKNGELKWKYQTGWGIDTIPTISDKTIYFGSNDNNFYALNINDGSLKWYYSCNSGIHSSPVPYGEYVFFGSDDGRLYAIEKITGKIGWSFAPEYSISEDNVDNFLTTPITTKPIIEDNIVYISTQNSIYALDSQTEKIINNPIQKNNNNILPNSQIIILLAIIILTITILLIYKKRKNN